VVRWWNRRTEIWFHRTAHRITAAVVGVILNLAVFFAWHVFWPEGFSGRFEWFSVLVGLAAIIALWPPQERDDSCNPRVWRVRLVYRLITADASVAANRKGRRGALFYSPTSWVRAL